MSTTIVNEYPLARWEQTIAEGFAGARPLDDTALRGAVMGAIAALDGGHLRVASPPDVEGGEWVTHAWVKQAILLYFRMTVSETWQAGPLEFHDKIPPKHGLEAAGVRVVPPGVARYGSFLERGVILMPGYVNIGARVGEGSMVDTWAGAVNADRPKAISSATSRGGSPSAQATLSSGVLWLLGKASSTSETLALRLRISSRRAPA